MTVPTDPNLTRQPATLDPKVEIPEDPALAMGHTEEKAADHTAALEEFKSAVEDAEGAPEVTARAPGDHAGSDSDDSDCPPSGTIEETKTWVGDDPGRAQQALEAERAGQNRTTLVSWLEDVAG